MPSTRKQKPKVKRSGQPDVLCDLEIVDIMIGSYSRNDIDCQSGGRETEGDFEFNISQESSNQNSEDFRSPLNTNRIENSILQRRLLG